MFAARREHLERGDRAGARARRLGAVRPLHRRDVRLPGRRPRRAARAHRRARALDPRPIASPISRSCSTCRPACRASASHARSAEGRELDKFEREQVEFFERVRGAYLERAAPSPRVFASSTARPRGRAAEVRASSSRSCSRHGDDGRRADEDRQRRRPGPAAACRGSRRRARRASPSDATGRMPLLHSPARAASASARWRSIFARALLCETPRAGRRRVRNLCKLPLCDRRPAPGPAAGRAAFDE